MHTVPARLSVSLLPERILWVHLGIPLVSHKAHGCHGKITRFQIILSLGATKSVWSGSWIQFWILPKKHTLRLVCLYSSYSHELGKRKQQLTIERNWKTNLFCINAHTRATLDRRIRYPQSHWDECCSQAFSFLHTWRPGLKYFSQTAIIILRDLSKMVLHVFQRCTFNAL